MQSNEPKRSNKTTGKVTYRPGKSSGIMGLIFGSVFVLIGIFVAIPTFGAFGILWTLLAVCITGFNVYQAFGKGYQGPEIHFEQDGEIPGSSGATPTGETEQRLKELRALYDQRLITQEEYDRKREDILNRL